MIVGMIAEMVTEMTGETEDKVIEYFIFEKANYFGLFLYLEILNGKFRKTMNMEKLYWENEIEELLEDKKYKAMQLRSFRFDRFLKMAERVEAFEGSCRSCGEHKNEMISILTQLKNDNGFSDHTFQRYLLLFRNLAHHLKKDHHLILPHYFSSKYSFVGMILGLLISYLLWLVSGKTKNLAIDIKLLIMIGTFAGLAIGRIYGNRKDKQVVKSGKRIY